MFRMFNTLKRMLKHPIQSAKLICDYLYNDYLSLSGKVKYKHNILFIAGLPKSGTTWLSTELAKLPGYNIRIIKDRNNKTYNHDVGEDIFSLLPRNRYTVMKLHTRYSIENIKIVYKYVEKFIVICRDLRDMCVSRYYHCKNDDSHRHFELYNKLSIDEGIKHCIEVVSTEYVSWVRDWYNYANNRDEILLIKYEELNKNPRGTFENVLTFFEIYNNDFINNASSSKLTGEKNLHKELKNNLGLKNKSTARSGKVGEWKEVFSQDNIKLFKEVAGDVLILTGYEKDYDW